MSTVGVIVNPISGKDIRRLSSAASHTSDSAKIDIVRRCVIAAVESGAQRVLLAPDPHRLAQRAVADLRLPVELLDLAMFGSRSDSVASARAMQAADAGVVIVLGGDGTCRDVAQGWPEAPMIAISTGTNNVYPSFCDATSAGVAAGLLARDAIDHDAVARPSKRLTVTVTTDNTTVNDNALVDLALIDTAFVGSRAVLDPESVRIVVAAIATPASTGLSSIAGRLCPIDRWEPGGIVIRLGAGGRHVRAPLSPGSFSSLEVIEVRRLAEGEQVQLDGTGVLAFDGERDRRVGANAAVHVTVDMLGPQLIDVEATLLLASAKGLFELRPSHGLISEEDYGQ